MRRMLFALLFLSVSLGALPLRAANPDAVPVVLAVDTSRSLLANDFAAVRSKVAPQLGALPETTPVGVVAFGDDVEWVVPLGPRPANLGESIGRLGPKGKTTLLNDAIVMAARQFADGGIIVVVTDGRDEGSATTTDDVGKICRERGVRLLAGAIGKNVDTRSLRRLTLLAEGQFLGPLAGFTDISSKTASSTRSQSAKPSYVVEPVDDRGEEAGLVLGLSGPCEPGSSSSALDRADARGRRSPGRGRG